MTKDPLDSRIMKESYNKIRKQSIWKACFHHDNECSNEIIKAHSIQNNKILNKISRDGNVMQFELEIGNPFGSKMKKEGRKKVSTFTGFCGYHDAKLFSPIENYDYQPGNKEQELIFAYRSLAKEYHAKQTCLKMTQNIISLLDNGQFSEVNKIFERKKPSIEQINYLYEIMGIQGQGFAAALFKYENYRVAFENNMKNKKYHNLVTNVIVFDEEYHLAASSLINIVTDFSGKIINDLTRLDAYLAPLFINVFPQDGKTYVLMSHYRRDKERYKFLEQINKYSIAHKKIVLSNILVKYVENIAFSPTRWEELPLKRQEEINRIFAETTNLKGETLVSFHDLNVFI
ncbi:SecC motif-containing protein [Paenibacillus baekrokdamisoli]|uniref:SecC motif-containing protein n=1 Tax=Paenibacillus baekrokdamisoli TaxID=1712516 RepID=A0A3G9J3S4_9BACL|nr:hypothetical protein [Paenibacillus baekrokdamisoli]MBB3073513.1 hypothetical protein [Paenibacillus baekrokdamisoli]BBH20451.1 SecC motif-containing protein [Paenibacillus baekrokdamisoli]